MGSCQAELVSYGLQHLKFTSFKDIPKGAEGSMDGVDMAADRICSSFHQSFDDFSSEGSSLQMVGNDFYQLNLMGPQKEGGGFKEARPFHVHQTPLDLLHMMAVDGMREGLQGVLKKGMLPENIGVEGSARIMIQELVNKYGLPHANLSVLCSANADIDQKGIPGRRLAG